MAVAAALALLGAVALVAAGPAEANPQPSKATTAAFKRANPCPATGAANGTCPGYVVRYVVPPCAEGEDTESNLQWQVRAEAEASDRWERQYCRFHRQRVLAQAGA